MIYPPKEMLKIMLVCLLHVSWMWSKKSFLLYAVAKKHTYIYESSYHVIIEKQKLFGTENYPSKNFKRKPIMFLKKRNYKYPL